MFCENCGKELNNDVVFCKYCGAKVDDVNEANSNDKSNGNINVNNVPLNNKSQPVIENKGSKAKIIIQIVSATVVVIGIVVLLVVLLSSTKSFYEELIDKADNIAYKRYDKDYVDIKKSIGTAEYSCTSKDTSSRGKVDYDYYITENKVNELKTILKKYIHRAKKEDIHFYDDDPSKSNVDEYNIDDYYDVGIVIRKDDILIRFYRYDDGQDELALEIKIDNRKEIEQYIEDIDQEGFMNGASKVKNKNKSLNDNQIEQIVTQAVAERANYLYGVDKSNVNSSDSFKINGILRRDGSNGDGNIQVDGRYKDLDGVVSNVHGYFYVEIERDFTELGKPYKGIYEGIHVRFT
ncbi:MAG: zinc ribbon domain-containing protein [Lachnospiraceae bacterium]|nr:zinc ribbon domain-containing protein [Lachnospiraceae bacterium]